MGGYMNRFLVPALLACSISACESPRQAPPEMAWYKEGASDAAFNRDVYRCISEAARMFPATAGVQGFHDEDGGIVGSYDINRGNRLSAQETCMRVKGWNLIPRSGPAPAPTARPLTPEAPGQTMTCKANVYKASSKAAPRPINGGTLRFKVGRDTITVTTAEGLVVPYRVEGRTREGLLVAGATDPDGLQYKVHISDAPRAFSMMEIVGGEPKSLIAGPCT